MVKRRRSDNEQIQEVLNDFEKHAFSGLDPSQYHLFAVLHTDDDGSKHIHVLAPRLDIQSGKSLNIAPLVMKNILTRCGTTSTQNINGHVLMTCF
jgi:hypothetical protein